MLSAFLLLVFQTADTHAVQVQSSLRVPMRDGIALAADLYRPEGMTGPLPTILIRTPYNRLAYRGTTAPARRFAARGYAVLVQDTRGKFDSEGEYRVQNDDRNDGYDTMDWIVKQPWSTGRIGTYGCSYLGEVQYLLAKMQHPNHAAMLAQAGSGATGPAGGYYTNFGAYDGGAFLLSTAFGWFGYAGSKVRNAPRPRNLDFPTLLRSLPTIDMARKAGYAPSEFEDFLSHPPGDPWWNGKGYLRDDDRFDVPALHVNSWLDVTPEQTLYLFNLFRTNSTSQKARDNQFVIMSPTTHCASESATEHTRVGQLDVGDARLDYWKIYLDWFDHWLRGIDNGVTRRPKVTYYIMHQGWRTADHWPVPGTRETPFFLTSLGRANTGTGNGALSLTPPERDRHDVWTYDPANPVPSRGGTICCTGNPEDLPGIFNQSDLESREDLLVYTSPPLDRGLTIAGTVRVVLHVSSDAKDTDFNAKLLDVDSTGRAWNILNGVLRARYRLGMTRKVLMNPGETYELTVGLKATGYHFRPGHRIRLYLTSSDFPLYDRNLNTGKNNYDETEFVKATNTVYHGPRRPSRLVLPVVP